MTLPQEIALYRGRKRDDYETEQMASRVRYLYLKHRIPEDERRDALLCAHCAARLYLEDPIQLRIVSRVRCGPGCFVNPRSMPSCSMIPHCKCPGSRLGACLSLLCRPLGEVLDDLHVWSWVLARVLVPIVAMWPS